MFPFRIGQILLCAIVSTGLCVAFVPSSCAQFKLNIPDTNSVPQRIQNSELTVNAKRKRRRRKDGSGPELESNDDMPSFDTNQPDELPDFDLVEELDDKKPIKKPAAPVNPDVITPAMMGNADQPVGSIKELLSDRSLEARFEFEEPDDDSLPDLVELSRQDNVDFGTMGKKKARQAQRKAAAIAAKETGAGENGLLSNLPFVYSESFLKLEHGRESSC